MWYNTTIDWEFAQLINPRLQAFTPKSYTPYNNLNRKLK